MFSHPNCGIGVSEQATNGLTRGSGWNVVEHEILQQKAQVLGHLGGRVEQALATLRTFDAGTPGAESQSRRSALLDQAAERVWAFMIQRELCGLRYWEAVVKDYGIPREVLNRVGQIKPTATAPGPGIGNQTSG